MSLIHHVLLWEAKRKILARKRTFFSKKKVRKSAFSCHFKEKYRNFAVEPKH
mgnify:CR=1 FL=1